MDQVYLSLGSLLVRPDPVLRLAWVPGSRMGFQVERIVRALLLLLRNYVCLLSAMQLLVSIGSDFPSTVVIWDSKTLEFTPQRWCTCVRVSNAILFASRLLLPRFMTGSTKLAEETKSTPMTTGVPKTQISRAVHARTIQP